MNSLSVAVFGPLDEYSHHPGRQGCNAVPLERVRCEDDPNERVGHDCEERERVCTQDPKLCQGR